MLKLSFRVYESDLKNILYYLDNVNQLSWFKENGLWLIEIYTDTKNEIRFISNNIKKKYKVKSIKYETIIEKNWISDEQINKTEIKTNLFCISQKTNNFCNKKFSLTIPASTAFGTGSHASTFLVIDAIEFLNKFKRVNSVLDFGTGSGILSFVLVKLFRVKIFSSDSDTLSKKNYFRNKKKNQLSNLFFINTYNFSHYEFRSKSFDLIVANLLLNPLIKVLPSLKSHLKKNAYIILSGILEKQLNKLYSYYYTNGFTLIKKFVCDGWVCIILKKNGKK